MRRITGRPIGTCSASRTRSRTMASRSRPCGGTTRKRRDRLAGLEADSTSHPQTEAHLMGAYILRRLLLMIPTLFGIMAISFIVIQFAPGGPVEQVIANITGQGGGATDRISAAAAIRLPELRCGRRHRSYRGAQGLDPEFIAQLEQQFGFDKPPLERFATMIWNYLALRFRRELFPRHLGHRPDHREDAGLDLARPVDDAASPTRSRSRSASARRSRTARPSTSGPAASSSSAMPSRASCSPSC